MDLRHLKMFKSESVWKIEQRKCISNFKGGFCKAVSEAVECVVRRGKKNEEDMF